MMDKLVKIAMDEDWEALKDSDKVRWFTGDNPGYAKLPSVCKLCEAKDDTDDDTTGI